MPKIIVSMLNAAILFGLAFVPARIGVGQGCRARLWTSTRWSLYSAEVPICRGFAVKLDVSTSSGSW